MAQTGYSNIVSVTTPAIPKLLDTYSGAEAAYSLRKLSSAYSGDAILVRRASDSTTQSIGFVNNELDTATLESFCSGTDGFVTTWFDQSGSGNDAAQANASKQPKIVSSGSTILEGGKAALSFTNGPFLVSAFGSSTSTKTASIVFKGLANNFIFDDDVTININSLVMMPDGFSFRLYNNNINVVHSIAPDVWGDRHLGSFVSDGANSKVGIDGSFTSGTAGTDPMSGVTLGSAATGLLPLQGTIQEAVIYGSNQSANLSGIETNINNFYSIY